MLEWRLSALARSSEPSSRHVLEFLTRQSTLCTGSSCSLLTLRSLKQPFVLCSEASRSTGGRAEVPWGWDLRRCTRVPGSLVCATVPDRAILQWTVRQMKIPHMPRLLLLITSDQLGMVVHACSPGIWERGRQEDQALKATLSYVMSSRPG